MRLKISALILALFLTGQAVFAKGAWEFAGWLGAGCYPNVEFDPHQPGRVYLTSDVAGLWKSEDDGDSWQFATDGLKNLHIAALVVSAVDSKVLFAASEIGLHRSLNGAQTWQLLDGPAKTFRFQRPESYKPVILSSLNVSKLAAGTLDGSVWFSESGGETWTNLGKPFGKKTPITALTWNRNETQLYAASSDGLARYSLESSAWTNFLATPKPVTDIQFSEDFSVLYAAGQKHLMTSSDDGQTWKKGGAVPRGEIFRINICKASPATLLAAWNQGWKGGVALSRDGGQEWKEITKEMKPDLAGNPTRSWAGLHGRMNALKENPHKPGQWLRTDWWGVWRSEDGGITWDEKIQGAPNTVVSDILITKTGEIWVASMDNGLLRSRDGGKTYENMFPKNDYKDDENGHVWRVVQKADGSIAATSSPWNVSFDQVVLMDEAGQYEKVRSGLPPKRSQKSTVWNFGYARALAAHPTNSKILYLGIDGEDTGGFFVSYDGGRSWQRKRNQPGSKRIYNGLSVDPTNPARILWGASGAKGGVYLSEDGGESWLWTQKRMKRVYDVLFTDQGLAYAAGDMNGPAVFVSKDHGRSWKLLGRFGAEGSAEALCALPDGRILFSVLRWDRKAGGEIYISSHNQKHWARIDQGLPNGEGAAAIAYHPQEKAIYIGRFAGSVYKLSLDSIEGTA